MMADVPEGWSAAPPDTTLPIIRQRESYGGKNLPPEANYDYPHSHASGIYQYEPRTWKDMTQEFGAGQEYSEAYQAPKDVQDYVAYRTDQKYGPNSSYTWAASAPPGGYPTSRKEPLAAGVPKGWSTAKPKAPELPSGWNTSPPKTEPWRVPAANEGEIVHRQRGEPPQGPQRDPGAVDPEIAARRPMNPEMAKSIADQAGLTKWAQEQYKHGILSPDALSNALGAAMGGSMQVAHDALAKIGVPERLIRDAIQYATEFAPMQGGLGLKAPVPEAIKPAEAGAPKEIPVDKSVPSTPDLRAAEVGPKAVEDALKGGRPKYTIIERPRTPEDEGYEGKTWNVHDENGKHIAEITGKITDKNFNIDFIGLPGEETALRGKNIEAGALGVTRVRSIVDAIKQKFPEVKTVSGERYSGAHGLSAGKVPTVVQSIGAASTPLSQIVEHNMKTFADDNARTPGFKESLRAATNKIKQFVAPETIKDTLTGEKTGEQAAEIIRKNEGNENRTAIQAGAAIDKYSKFTGGLNMDEQLSMIKWMQSAEDKKPFDISGHPEAAGFADTFKKWMQKYETKLRALPDLDQMEFRQNFVHQMWMRPDSAMAKLFGPGRSGSSGFTKQHWYDDYEEGIRAGEAPFSTNPMEIFKRYVENAAKFIANKEIIQDGKDADLIRQLPAGAIPHPGWEPINSWSAPGAQLYAPEGFAKVFNSRASPPPNDLLRSVQFVTNKIAMTKLFWSGFHAALETKVAWASGLGDTMTKLARGDPIGAALQLGKTPFKPFTAYPAARKAWKTFKDDEWGDPTTQRIIQGLTDANFDFMREGHLADEYRASRLPGFIKSFQKGLLKTQARDAFAHIKDKPVTGMISELYDLGMRSAATVMEPTFQYYVPWLKTQAAVDAARTALEAHPDMTRAEFAKECIKIADNIDARFGEMNRNNIFWSQTQKAAAQSSALSYSYVYGIAKNALGTGFDVAKIPSRAYLKARGMSNEMIWTDRMSFMIGLATVAVTTNAIYQYLMTGNAPQTLDQAMQKPKTGGTVEGQPERAVIPGHENSYINFFRAPLHDAFDKLNPLWQTLIDLGEDKDYRDKQIWNPQDPMVKRILDSAKFAAAEMGEPVTFEREVDKKAGTNIGGLQTAVGIGPAGMRDTNPDKFNQMMNYKDSEARFKSRVAEINDRRVQAGKTRLIFKHNEQQKIIRAYMQHPEKDPLAAFDTGYGGTQ